MKKKRVNKQMILLLAILTIVIAAYRPIISYLEKQAANPQGLVGSIITRIWSGYFTDLNEWSLTHINLRKSNIILDVGFGGGSGIQSIAEQNALCTIYGIDISEEAVTTAGRLNQSYIDDGRVILKVGSAEALPFENGYFDLITANQTHIYWNDLTAGLTECYRTLSENGMLLISCEVDKISYYLPDFQNHNVFSDLLFDIGFDEVEISRHTNYIAFICTK